MNKQNQRRIIYIAGALIVIIIMILPIPLPYHLVTQGKIIPAKVWVVQRQNDGSLMVTLRDHLNNVVSSYTTYQVERGDVLNFELWPAFHRDGSIVAGDTVGTVQSNVINGEMARLSGALAVARSALQVNESGEKESLVNAARDQALLNRERAELQQKILERQQDLYNRQLISQETYEITQGTAKIYELEAAVSEAQLKALESGSKPEQIQLALSEINSLEGEIKILEQRLNQCVLISPISGRLYTLFSADTLLYIADTGRVVYMPIPTASLAEVEVNQVVQVKNESSVDVIKGKIYRIDKMIQRLNAKQVFFVIALLEKESTVLPINQIASCTIQGRSKTPLMYLGKIVQTVFN
jgi:hypothetical protein